MGEIPSPIIVKIEENARKNLNRIRKSTMDGDREKGIHVSDIVTFNLCKRKAMFDAYGVPQPPTNQDQLEILSAGNIVHDFFDKTIKEQKKITLSGEKKIKATLKMDKDTSIILHGEVDSIGKVDGIEFILDWKTWNSYGGGRKHLQVKEDHLLQMSLYAMLIEESTGKRIDYGVISYLDFAKRLGKEENRAVKLLTSVEAFKLVREYWKALQTLYDTENLPPVERQTDPKKNPYPVWLCHWASGGCPYVKICLKDSPKDGEGKIAKADKMPFNPLLNANALTWLVAIQKISKNAKKGEKNG